MKEKNIDQAKVYAAMRSIYRFSEFTAMEVPEIIIDTERTILNRHFSGLTAEEIVYMVEHFQNFQKTQVIQTTLENEKMRGNLNRYLTETN